MTPLALLFAAAEKRLSLRVEKLAERLEAGEDCWAGYVDALVALKRLVGDERTPLLTTQQMGEKLAITARTVRRLGKRGKLESVRLGEAGRAAIRWRA